MMGRELYAKWLLQHCDSAVSYLNFANLDVKRARIQEVALPETTMYLQHNRLVSHPNFIFLVPPHVQVNTSRT